MTYHARPLMPWDADALFRITSDPIVTRFLGFHTHERREQAETLIGNYNAGSGHWRGVWDDDKLVGVICAELQGHSAAMMIYFSREARGAGRSVAVPFVRQLFLTRPEVVRAWAYCHTDNVPVQRVLERMGAEREGRLRRFEFFPNVSTEPQDVYVYSILRDR